MAQKTCPGCQKKVGPALRKCECGYVFAKKNGDKPPENKPAEVKPAALDKRILDTLQQPAKVDGDLLGDSDPPLPKKQPAEVPPLPIGRLSRGILCPAGDPPCKPAGFKDTTWPDGPCPDEDVIEWALSVRDKGLQQGLHYAPEAVRYFIRFFWDINSPEYPRIRGLVQAAFYASESE